MIIMSLAYSQLVKTLNTYFHKEQLKEERKSVKNIYNIFLFTYFMSTLCYFAYGHLWYFICDTNIRTLLWMSSLLAYDIPPLYVIFYLHFKNFSESARLAKERAESETVSRSMRSSPKVRTESGTSADITEYDESSSECSYDSSSLAVETVDEGSTLAD